jgi:2-polyprenyl-3-methyl-5-hydroxy-6-metoxy-1,4-benzoquinol methylase
MRRFEVYRYHKPTTKRLIDVGCGEGQYIKKYIDDVDFYYALDVDQDCVNTVRKKISRNGWEEKLQVFDNIDTLLENLDACVPHDVIMTEVLEHMEYQESIDFVDKVLKGVNVSKLTLTTPNKRFNKYYYQDANQLRHYDHKFELSLNELNVYLDEIVNKNTDYQILHITSIGDCVRECENTESVSFLVQIAKKGQ